MHPESAGKRAGGVGAEPCRPVSGQSQLNGDDMGESRYASGDEATVKSADAVTASEHMLLGLPNNSIHHVTPLALVGLQCALGDAPRRVREDRIHHLGAVAG